MTVTFGGGLICSESVDVWGLGEIFTVTADRFVT
jgi:hypothetical protein